jgi:Mn2+/Fe2+ NRAMP family transporter
LIAFALGLVVFALTAAIAVLSVAILGGGGQQAVASAAVFNPTSVAEILSPAGLVYVTIVSIGAALTSPITMCPPAAIYVSLTGGAPPVSRTFE